MPSQRAPKKKSNSAKSRQKSGKVIKKVTKKAKEVYRLKGRRVISKVKELVREGNVSRITIKDKKGKTVFVMPVTAGVLGAVFLWPLAVIATVLVFSGEYDVVVDRRKK